MGDVRRVLEGCRENDDLQLSRSAQMHARAIRRGQGMWASRLEADEEEPLDTAGHIPSMRVVEYGKAARAAGRQKDTEVMPFAGRTAPMVAIHGRCAITSIAGWLRRLESDRFVAHLACGLCCQIFIRGEIIDQRDVS